MSLLCLLTAGFGGERYGRTLPAVSGRIHKSIQLQMHAVLDLSAHSPPASKCQKFTRHFIDRSPGSGADRRGGRVLLSSAASQAISAPRTARGFDISSCTTRASLSKGKDARAATRFHVRLTSEHGDALCGHCLGAIPCVFGLSSRPCCTVPTIFNHTPFLRLSRSNFNGECFLRLFFAPSLNETLSQAVRQGHNA